jgi:hypothetical protein
MNCSGASGTEPLSALPRDWAQRPRLQLDRPAYERTPAQRKSPRQMCRAADADAFVCHNIETRLWIRDKTVARIDAQIHLMMSSGDCEGLREFPRTGAELTQIVNAAAALYQFNAASRFKRANQNKAVLIAFYEHVQHPMHAVIKIHVRRASFVALDKVARARSRKRVCGFIIDCRIRFHLDDYPGAFAPYQFSADKFARTHERIALEERCANKFVQLPTPTLSRSDCAELSRRLIEDRNLHVAFDRLTVSESRNEFRASEIRKRRIPEAKQRWFLR